MKEAIQQPFLVEKNQPLIEFPPKKKRKKKINFEDIEEVSHKIELNKKEKKTEPTEVQEDERGEFSRGKDIFFLFLQPSLLPDTPRHKEEENIWFFSLFFGVLLGWAPCGPFLFIEAADKINKLCML